MSTSQSRSGIVLELAEEFLERYRKGQRPALQEYVDLHPSLAAEIRDRFYGGGWMGAPVIERMIQLTGRSSQFRDLMRDLFAGSQEYSDLRERLYRSLPRIAAEALVNTLWNRNARTGLRQFAGAGNRT